MSAEGYRLGIDFGTSTTVAMLGYPDGRVNPLLFDASPLLASAVFAGPDSQILTGIDAERAAMDRPDAFDANPKRRIDEGMVWLGEQEVSVVELIAAVLGRVAAEACRVAGGRPGTVVLTHPATWGRTRLAVLAAAASRTQLGEVRFVAEPVAAAAQFVTVLRHDLAPGQSLIVYDLGAGTFDVSIVRRSPNGFEMLAADGLSDIGGLDLDDAVVGHARALTASATEAWQRLDRARDLADRQARHKLWQRARAAKEQLSRDSNADLHLPLVGARLHLTRDELDTIARPILERTVALTVDLVQRAGIAQHTIGGVFLVGGSSRMPLPATVLHRAVQIAPIVVDQPELVVAEGSLHVRTGTARATARPDATSPPPSGPTIETQSDAAQPASRGLGLFDFAGEWWSRPHDLAAAMSVEWARACQLFSGQAGADLGYWLRIEVGDLSFPLNRLYRQRTTPDDADESVAVFVAHFAPDVRPRFRGQIVDAEAVVQLCERAIEGDDDAMALLDGLTEPVVRALAKHRCNAGHDGCGYSGCARLAGSWAAWEAGSTAVASAMRDVGVHSGHVAAAMGLKQLDRPRQRTLPEPVTMRMKASLWRAAVDPSYPEQVYQALHELPAVPRSPWWIRIYDQARTSTGPAQVGLCLLLVELGAAAAAVEAARRLRQRRFMAVGAGAVPGVLAAPALVAGLIGSIVAGDSVPSAKPAPWLFGIALAIILVGEALLLMAMEPAPTLRVGAAFAWSGLLMAVVVGLSFPEFRFLKYWSWLGYCTCIPVVFVFMALMGFSDETRPKSIELVPGSKRPRL